MSYNSPRKELFLADISNNVVRSLIVGDHAAADLCKVFTGTEHEFVMGLCYMSESDTLLVCTHKKGPTTDQDTNWLVALNRNGGNWLETCRSMTAQVGKICCALSGSRVLIGHDHSTYLELFRVDFVRGLLQIVSVNIIRVPKLYIKFSASCDNETLLAMSYIEDDNVHVHRLRGDTLALDLESSASTQFDHPLEVLWHPDNRLFATEHFQSRRLHKVIELVFDESGNPYAVREHVPNGTDPFEVRSWCGVGAGFLLIFDRNTRDLLYFSLG